MTRVKIETEVDLTPELMAKVFARMSSDQQAFFLSTCWHELLEACEGHAGAERQMSYVYSEDTFDDDARELIKSLSPLPDEVKAPKVAIDTETVPGSPWGKIAALNARYYGAVFQSDEERRVAFAAAYGLGAAAYQRDTVRTATEELAKREAKAREVAALIPHVAFRFNIERMQNVHDSVLMDAYAEVDVLDPGRELELGGRYYLQGYPIGTVTRVDEGMPGEMRQVTVRLDYVLPDLQPCAVPPTCGQRFDNVGPQFGGTYQQPSSAQAEARAHRVCPECKGTGWYEGFAKRERCSRGCAC